MDWEPLIAAARAVREHAYAPYSGFPVGAALATDDGAIFVGCNVENLSYGVTVCAERNAVSAAIAGGSLSRARRAVAVAVIADAAPLAPPCGICLQTLSEFARDGDLPLLLCNPAGDRREWRLRELLPVPFVFDLPVPRPS
jgi:cytidine deaminase